MMVARPVVTVLVTGDMGIRMSVLIPVVLIPMMLVSMNVSVMRWLVVAVFTDMMVGALVVLIKVLLRSGSSVVAYFMVSNGVSRAVLYIMRPHVF